MGAYRVSEELPNGWMIYFDLGNVLYYLSPEGTRFSSKKAVRKYLTEEFVSNVKDAFQEKTCPEKLPEKKTKSLEDAISRKVKADRKRLTKRVRQTSLRQNAMNLFMASKLRSEYQEQIQSNCLAEYNRGRCCQSSGNSHRKVYKIIKYIKKSVIMLLAQIPFYILCINA